MNETDLKPPLILLIIYRFISALLFIIAVLTSFVTLYNFYTVTHYIPFIFLSFAFFGFFFAYGFWNYRRWLIIPLGLNFVSVIVINILKLTYVWEFSQKGITTALISMALAAGLLALAYFSRQFLTGISIKPASLTVFVFFWIVCLLNYSSFIRNLLKCCL